jgi:hypothetical protein
VALTEKLEEMAREPAGVGLAHAGGIFRVDGLTVDELDHLALAGTPKLVAALLRQAGADPDQVRWADVRLVDVGDDLPDTFTDGIPTTGGRALDAYLVAFSKPPFCWPPDVIRRQTLRDLNLILAAWEASG